MKKYIFTETQIKRVVDMIVNEQTTLNEQHEILTLRDLATLLARSEGTDMKMMFELLHDEYKNGGDPAIIKLFHDYSGVDLTDISHGHYILK
jgi:hypothetical protein